MTTPVQKSAFPIWHARLLLGAGCYNLAWGAGVVLWPMVWFEWAGMEAPRYPELWQCIGMIVGVYGVGYLTAAADPVRHWPIVLVGLLGKVFGPIGFIKAWMDGRFESDFAWVILANDLIWWIPFSLILINAARHGSGRKSVAGAGARPEDGPLLRGAVTQDGQNLLDMSYEGPLLIVFLRHFGCTFCREAISELAAKQAGISATGSRLVFLHRSEESGARTFFEQFGMEDVPRVADPDGKVYRSFGLGHGRWKQLFGWRVIQRAYEAGWVKGHGLGLPQGDVRQMPGVFLLYRGELVKSFRHRLASDQPDYSRMANIWPFNLTADAMRRQAGEQGDTGFGGLVSGIGNN